MVDEKKRLSQNTPKWDIEQKEKEDLIAIVNWQKQKLKELQAQKAKQAEEWLSKEITSREYTDKEMHDIYRFIKQGKQKEAFKILLKGHQCPMTCYCQKSTKTCYCQKSTKTWQEKIEQGNKLIELAEKEIKEAEKIRIREGTELLLKHFNSK